MLSIGRKSEIKKAAVETLKVAGVCSLPIDLNRIFLFYGWGRLTFKNAQEKFILTAISRDGYTIAECVDGVWIYAVVYNTEFTPQRIRWTLAHEIGHIMLGHIHNKVSATLANEESQYFAEQLLSPVAVLSVMGAKTESDIARLCNISMEAARWRMLDLERHFKYKRKYGYTKDDKAFLEQFDLL